MIVAAVPVASKEACSNLQPTADRVSCLKTPAPSRSAGHWQERFPQIADREVMNYMDRLEKEARR